MVVSQGLCLQIIVEQVYFQVLRQSDLNKSDILRNMLWGGLIVRENELLLPVLLKLLCSHRQIPSPRAQYPFSICNNGMDVKD